LCVRVVRARRSAQARHCTLSPPAGTATQQLHHVSYDMHAELAETLGVTSYRRISTLSVRTRPNGAKGAMPPPAAWLDGEELVSASLMDANTAQACARVCISLSTCCVQASLP
jgi:hypothetical protein